MNCALTFALIYESKQGIEKAVVWREGRENAGRGAGGNNSKKEIIEKKKENRSGDRFLDVFFLASFVFV